MYILVTETVDQEFVGVSTRPPPILEKGAHQPRMSLLWALLVDACGERLKKLHARQNWSISKDPIADQWQNWHSVPPNNSMTN